MFVSPAERPKDINAFYMYKVDPLEGVSGGKLISYSAPTSRKFIGRSILEQDWPALQVKETEPDIEMCWAENRGLLVFKRVTSQVGVAKDCPSFDRHAAMAAKGFYTEKNPAMEQEIVGNNAYETNWSRELPASTTSPVIPWSWTRGAAYNYFPNMFLRRDAGFRFVVTKRQEIWKMLRFRRRLANGHYEYLDKTSKEHLGRYLEEVPTGGLLEEPRIQCGFMDVLQTEHVRIVSCIDRTVWPFEDFVTMKYDQLVGYESQATFKITSLRIVKVIFILMENNSAKRERYYGNYTSDSTGVTSGWDVVDSVTFHRDTTKVSYRLATIKTLMREHFPSVPVSRGILAIPLCMNPRLLEENVGVSIGGQANNTIEIKLKDCSPYHDQDKTTKFRPYIVLQIIRNVIFSKDPGPEMTFTPRFD